jgi:predicted aspartyl protease
MTHHTFNPNARLLIFECKIEFIEARRVWLALDTGASSVAIAKEILELIGYDLDATSERASFGDASQSHIVPKVTLKSLSLETARQENVEALAYTLPEEYGIDGVIGLNFLRRFKRVTLDFEQGVITLENG